MQTPAPLNDYLDSILYDFSCDPALAVVGFRAVDEANRTTPSYEKEPNIFSLLLGQKMYARCQNFLERKEDRLCVWMCAIAIRRTAFEELGRFDTDLEMLDLDLDFGMRVNRSQWKTKINQDLIVFHKGGGSPMLLSKRLLRLYKSRWILLRKHHKIRHPWLAKIAILSRLKVEYFLLNAFGLWLFHDSATRHDKIDGRKNIIQYCQKNY